MGSNEIKMVTIILHTVPSANDDYNDVNNSKFD